jgi:hypothetical protein
VLRPKGPSYCAEGRWDETQVHKCAPAWLGVDAKLAQFLAAPDTESNGKGRGSPTNRSCELEFEPSASQECNQVMPADPSVCVSQVNPQTGAFYYTIAVQRFNVGDLKAVPCSGRRESCWKLCAQRATTDPVAFNGNGLQQEETREVLPVGCEALTGITEQVPRLVRYSKPCENYVGLLKVACGLLWYRQLHRLQSM